MSDHKDLEILKCTVRLSYILSPSYLRQGLYSLCCVLCRLQKCLVGSASLVHTHVNHSRHHYVGSWQHAIPLISLKLSNTV